MIINRSALQGDEMFDGIFLHIARRFFFVFVKNDAIEDKKYKKRLDELDSL